MVNDKHFFPQPFASPRNVTVRFRSDQDVEDLQKLVVIRCTSLDPTTPLSGSALRALVASLTPLLGKTPDRSSDIR